jgi:hypothetical protein
LDKEEKAFKSFPGFWLHRDTADIYPVLSSMNSKRGRGIALAGAYYKKERLHLKGV